MFPLENGGNFKPLVERTSRNHILQSQFRYMKLTSLSILHSTPKENPWKFSQLISLYSLFSILWKSWWISSFQAGRLRHPAKVRSRKVYGSDQTKTTLHVLSSSSAYLLIVWYLYPHPYLYIDMLYLYLYIYICLCYLLTQYPEVKSLLAKKGVSDETRLRWTALNHPGNSSETLRCPHWRSSKSSKR